MEDKDGGEQNNTESKADCKMSSKSLTQETIKVNVVIESSKIEKSDEVRITRRKNSTLAEEMDVNSTVPKVVEVRRTDVTKIQPTNTTMNDGETCAGDGDTDKSEMFVTDNNGSHEVLQDEQADDEHNSIGTKLNLEETNIKSVDSGLPDSEDEQYLKDVCLGFDDENNLKDPLIGFSEAHEAKIFPMVDEQSMMLYEIVQTMESKQMASDISSILSYKEPIVVPRCKYLLPGGGDISMRILRSDATKQGVPADSVMRFDNDGSNEIFFTPEKLVLLSKPLNNGWRREIVMRSDGTSVRKAGEVYYYTPDNLKMKSSKQITQYLLTDNPCGLAMENFSFAKIRASHDPNKETIRTALDSKIPTTKSKHVGKTDSVSKDIGDDFDVDKQSKTLTNKGSSTRRSIQPPKRYSSGENVFYPDKKTKVSSKASDRDRDRDQNDSMMEMGMLPPKYPKGKEDTSTPITSLTLSPDTQQEVRRRGRPPKPGGKKDLLVQAQALAAAKEAAGISDDADDNDSMFQISAFRQSHSLMEAAMEQYQEMQDMEMDSDSADCGGNPSVPIEDNSYSGYNQSSEQLLPCSIRCSGMTGEIPTLQCKRCLCLYHPECLGLPPNLNFKNFFCSNCEGESTEERMTAAASPALNVKPKQPDVKKSVQEVKKMADIKKPPPPLIRASFQKLPNKFNSEVRPRLPPPPRLPLLQPAMSLGRGGIRMKHKIELTKLTPPQLSMLRPVSSDVTMSISPISMKRGRGRPPKNSKLLPQMSRNLTITPISIPKKIPPPPVPNLHPVGPVGMFAKRPTNVKPDWIFSKASKGAIAKAMANIKASPAPPKLKTLIQKKIEKPPEIQGLILQQQKELNKEKPKTQDNPTPPTAFRAAAKQGKNEESGVHEAGDEGKDDALYAKPMDGESMESNDEQINVAHAESDAALGDHKVDESHDRDTLANTEAEDIDQTKTQLENQEDVGSTLSSQSEALDTSAESTDGLLPASPSSKMKGDADTEVSDLNDSIENSVQ